jgi:curved DNA-binding protein CbpA
MGGTSSRPKTFEQYYQSVNQHGGSAALDEDLDVDPYYVLDVSKNFEWDELVAAYRRLARLVHPDKGGPHEKEVRTKMFRMATKCFRDLAQEYKNRSEGRSHHDLKREAQAYYEANPARYTQAQPHPSRAGGGGGGRGGGGADGEMSFIDRFNNMFDQNKLDDDESGAGYGQMMAPSSKDREDIAVPQIITKFSKQSFNDTFDKHTLPSKREVVVYKEPEALPMGKKMAYTELGGERPDDFGSTREGTKQGRLDFTDYMRAHTTSRLVDPKSVKERKDYKNVDAYEADRAKAMAKPPTREELALRAQRESEDKRMELMRIERLKQRDALAQEHHDRVSRMMLR